MQCKVYPTIITPFLEDGTIDFKSLRKLIELYASCGFDGVFGVCQSGEMFYLSDDEKLALAEFTITVCHECGMKCVVSGHTQDDLRDQLNYLQRLEALKPDAVVLVSNRLAREGEPEEKALRNLDEICKSMLPDTKLGIYECPQPYKRSISPEMLEYVARDGRFGFIKDTCCDMAKIAGRLERLSGTGIELFNANAATLFESLELGAAGYSGVLTNLMPEMFTLLKAACDGDVKHARYICNYISAVSVIELQNYPANAKYVLQKRGILMSTRTRNGRPKLNESQQKELDAFIDVCQREHMRNLSYACVQISNLPDTAFRECHASTILPCGERVLSVYFAGEREGADDVGIWLSVCEGGQWRNPRRIAKVAQVAHWNPVIFQAEDCVRVIFKVGPQISTWRSYEMHSQDQGKTWSDPRPLNADNPAGGPVRNKPIVLSNGVLLAPNSDESEAGWFPRIDYSVDGGCTFSKLADIPINRSDVAAKTYMAGKGAIQPTIWESAPGQVHALLRTTAGRIFRSDSSDYGRSWCMAYPTNLPNNNSGIDVVRVDGRLYLVMNPVSGNWAARTPLVVLRSDDNGRNFEVFKILSDVAFDEYHGRMAEFSYPAIVAHAHRLYVSYTYMRKAIAFCRIDV